MSPITMCSSTRTTRRWPIMSTWGCCLWVSIRDNGWSKGLFSHMLTTHYSDLTFRHLKLPETQYMGFNRTYLQNEYGVIIISLIRKGTCVISVLWNVKNVNTSYVSEKHHVQDQDTQWCIVTMVSNLCAKCNDKIKVCIHDFIALFSWK